MLEQKLHRYMDNENKMPNSYRLGKSRKGKKNNLVKREKKVLPERLSRMDPYIFWTTKYRKHLVYKHRYQMIFCRDSRYYYG
ncbi:hypothetical protein KUTeg_023633 [Tegillarca granosa]|uniref:Uncharacterized protein n=1 Tax=Tegillarca granosa TaxID=220873 RepID=A0ABQ9E280_TEGGR|nr:hypothetical protein KUTeg_023633 [Tegillarca granosa]